MRRLSWLAALPLLASCSLIFDAGDLTGDGGGLDAATRDAGVDAGVEVDAGVDAGPDAGVDAGPCETDFDDDTYVSEACGGPDCDDSEATVFPGATSDCGGVVSDCTMRPLGVALAARAPVTPTAVDPPVFALEATLSGDGSVLALGLRESGAGSGVRVLRGLVEGALASVALDGFGCVVDVGARVVGLAPGPAQTAYVTLARDATGGSAPASAMAQVFTLATPGSTVVGDCIHITSVASYAPSVAAALTGYVPGTGETEVPVPAALGIVPVDRGCLTAGEFTCGTVDDDPRFESPTSYGASVGGMVLGVRIPRPGAIEVLYRNALGPSGPVELLGWSSSRPTGGLAAARDGVGAMLALPASGTLLLGAFDCTTSACTAPVEDGPILLELAAGVPSGDPHLSLAPLGAGRFLLGYAVPAGVALRVVTRSAGTLTVSDAVELSTLRFDDRVIDLAVVSQLDEDARVTVVVLTAPSDPGAERHLHRVGFDLCAAP